MDRLDVLVDHLSRCNEEGAPESLGPKPNIGERPLAIPVQGEFRDLAVLYLEDASRLRRHLTELKASRLPRL